MKFDIIIGNPPYQLSDGGAQASAKPLYHLFIENAIQLSPKYISMIIPSRWTLGGKGLDQFRNNMLKDTSLRILHDFIDSKECFPNNDIKGGVCYFLWDRDNKGNCSIFTHKSDGNVDESTRPLLEDGMDTFIRREEQLSILKKIKKFNESSFISMVCPNDVFGFDVRVENSMKRIKPVFKLHPFSNSYAFYYYGWLREGVGYVNSNLVRKGYEYIDKWKVYISRAYGAGEEYPHQILNTPFLGIPNSVCTETYTLIGPYDTREEAINVISYIKTKFFRFMVALLKNTQSASQRVFTHVPIQDFSKEWTDQLLYAKYELNNDEIEFIESMIRPMGDPSEERTGDEDDE